MAQPFLAMIIPVSSGAPDQGLPGVPPGVNVPGFPTHPIAPGGGGGVGIWPSPGYPSHPIAPGGQPPGIWPQPPVGIWPRPPGGGGGGGAPDNSLPPGAVIPPPQVGIPVFPTNPIAPGGSPGAPDNTLPGGQPGVSNPISGGFILVFHPSYGWVLVSASGSGSGGGSGGGKPDQGLPGEQPKPDQGLPSTPPSAQPKR
jgi:hypothetical protein